jgi:hypothetical protein
MRASLTRYGVQLVSYAVAQIFRESEKHVPSANTALTQNLSELA